MPDDVMRCDRCRHWVKDDDGYQQVRDIGRCSKAIELWEATEWTKDEDNEDSYCDRTIKPEYAGQMSFAMDASQYSASLWTKPQFFCAHFEAPARD